MYKWLQDHKTESIAVQIKRENERSGGKISDQTFVEEVIKLILKKQEFWCLDTKLPKLDHVRGKILLLRRYDRQDTEAMGINVHDWPGEGTNNGQVKYMIQDDFEASEEVGFKSLALYLKWKMTKVESHCRKAVNAEVDRLCLNFVSYAMGKQFLGYIGQIFLYAPEDFALGKSGLNDWFRSEIIGRAETSPARFGVCLFDFPNQGLIEDVIATNKPYA